MTVLRMLMVALALSACTPDDTRARRVLALDGFTDVELQGYAWFACGRDDIYAVSFRAKRLSFAKEARVDVSGVLCCGLLKGCTVRF